MRSVGLVAVGISLLALDGALCHTFHLELMHPDPVLLLDVFVALHLQTVEGVCLVFLLGVSADSFAGTPLGMLLSIHLLVWMAVRWSRRFLISTRWLVQLGTLFVASLLSSLLLIISLAMMEVGGGPIWASLKVMFPLALVHLVVAIPVWTLARWVRAPSSEPRRAAI